MAWTAPRDWSTISAGIVTAASLNTHVRDNLGVLSTHTHTGEPGFGASSMSGLTLTGLVTLTFANQSANPGVAGELQMNGTDLLWYGSSVVNLTAADQAAGTASLRSLSTSSTTAAAGNHTHVPASQATGLTDNGAVLLDSDDATEMVTLTATPGATNRSWVIDGSFVIDGNDTNTYSAVLYFDATALQTRTSLVRAGGANTAFGLQGFTAGPSVGSHTIKITAQRTTGSATNAVRGHVAFREVST
jgi:hypothetical protein